MLLHLTRRMTLVLDNTSTTKHWDENVQRMCSLVSQHKVFTQNATINRGLVNMFTGTQATPEQSCDLLNARKIGQQGYINYVTHNTLRLSSVTNLPVRCKQLLTMAPPKATKRRLSQKEKEE